MMRFIRSLLRRNLFTPLLGIVAFLAVVITPLVIAVLDSSGFDDSGSGAYRYEYQAKALERLEKNIASTNRRDDYIAPSAPMYLDLDIEKIRPIDFSSQTIFLSGVVRGVWSEKSLGKESIAPRLSFSSARLRQVEANEDLMAGLVIDGLLQDDFYSYEPVLLRQEMGKNGRYWVGEYAFSGNYSFSPRLLDYPVDAQKVEIRIFHGLLPSYRLKLSSIKKGLEDFGARRSVANYRVSSFSNSNSFLSAPFSERFEDAVVKGKLPTLSSSGGATQKEISSLKKIESVYFSDEVGPSSVALWTLTLRRQLSTTWLRFVFPVSLLLVSLVVASYIPKEHVEVRLAIPPTVLLSLVFLQQGALSDVPDLGQPMLLDYYYLLAYVATLAAFVEFIVASHFLDDERSAIPLAFTRVSRVGTMFVAAFGAPLIWVLGSLSSRLAGY